MQVSCCDDGATVSRAKSFQALPPIFLQSCETKSGTESLGSRLCLPHQHSTTWHACRMCGHAYPASIPPHGMLARSVGMLTPPAFHHMACLPDLWACLPILPSGLNNDIEPLTHLMPMEDLQACLNILLGHCSFLSCPFCLLPAVALDTRYNATSITSVSGPVFLTITPSHFFFY